MPVSQFTASNYVIYCRAAVASLFCEMPVFHGYALLSRHKKAPNAKKWQKSEHFLLKSGGEGGANLHSANSCLNAVLFPRFHLKSGTLWHIVLVNATCQKRGRFGENPLQTGKKWGRFWNANSDSIQQDAHHEPSPFN